MNVNSSLRTDKELVEMYRRNVNRVYKICYIYLKNMPDAEDAVQSVFLKFLQSNVTFHDDEHEKAWFITVAKNCSKDILKSWWRRQRVDLETLPEMILQGDTQEVEIQTKLLTLPEKYRVILHLYYLEEYTVKEIASLLGRSESTIRSQLQRGRQKIKNDSGGEIHERQSCKKNIQTS